jgi:mono/diheme cytochrome c family protein
MKTASFILLVALGLGLASARAGDQKAGKTSGTKAAQDTLALPNPEADTLKNPVKVTRASLAEGKTLFSRNCATCHGANGKADNPVGRAFTPPARNLTDTTWQRRFSDGQIFAAITTGVPGTGMVAYVKALGEEDRWTLVNYIRTLAARKRGK